MIVDPGAMIEDHKAGHGGSVESQADGVGEGIDRRCDDHRFGLGDDRPDGGGRRAGLQWYRHRAQHRQSHVDGGVVDAGEAQHRHAVARMHIGQRGGDGVDAA